MPGSTAVCSSWSNIPPLSRDDVNDLLEAARMNWRDIEPAILGTLFERGLNPELRSQLGAHYTDPATINKLIEPVIVRPLQQEWEAARAHIQRLSPDFGYAGKKSNAARREAEGLFAGYLERLKKFKVLDPACGSGNFLYLSLKALKDLEHRANLDAEALGLHRQVSIEVSPSNVMGIELNAYAAELARVTVWIGEIQWMLKHGYTVRRDPILAPLDHIECRDAILIYDDRGNPDAGAMVSEPEWPTCDAIVGNPPFLGDKMMRSEMGAEYVTALRTEYEGRVPGGADLVTYWFEKARAHIEAGKCSAAGLVATNSIRGGANRRVLDRVVTTARVFEAWSDEPWVNEGAAVRVSLICFTRPDATSQGATLNGNPVAAIHADLTAGVGVNLTKAEVLPENRSACFVGTSKKASFDLPGEVARGWLTRPNPNGLGNHLVAKPWINGNDLVQRPSDTWIVDFGVSLTEAEAALFEAPFDYVVNQVKPEKMKVRAESEKRYWWLHARTAPDMRATLVGRSRYIATSIVAKHRLFVWRPVSVLPSHAVCVVAREDDVTFGVLQSRFHVLWSLRLGTSLEDRPRYTPSSCFETFPFPPGMTPRDTAAGAPSGETAEQVALASRRLVELREAWLNPVEWVNWVRTPEEERAGFPSRPVAKPGHEADLKKRTLTNLYNAQPPWLEMAHQQLDAAVAMAYGWADYGPEMEDDEVLRRLLALNAERLPQ